MAQNSIDDVSFEALQELIKNKGHLNADENVGLKGVTGITVIKKVTFKINGTYTEFEVHADCRVAAIKELLKHKDEKLSVMDGEEGGWRLAVGGIVIDKLYIYKPKKGWKRLS